MLGQLTSWVANTGFRSTEKPTSPLDFMPSQRTKQEQAAKPKAAVRMTKKRRRMLADQLNATLGVIARQVG